MLTLFARCPQRCGSQRGYARLLVTGMLVAAVSASATGAFAQKRGTESIISDTNNGFDISGVLKTSAFYDAGYTGTRSIVANIEAGFFYKYHPALASDQIQLAYGGTYPAPLGPDPNDPSKNAVHDPNLTNDPLWTQYDQHATATAGIIGAAPLYAGDPRAGIAYGAQMVAGSVATDWVNPPGSLSFDVSDQSFFTPYIEALQTGITGLNGRLANVVNGSYGFQDDTYANGGTGTSGSDAYTIAFDGLARSSGATVVWSSGNEGYGIGEVNDPGAGYNGITVGATYYGGGTDPYTQVASFSSGGFTDFLAPGGTPIQYIRAAVDIVAPGQAILTAAYGGATGGNLGRSLPYDALAPQGYGSFDTGTSFSAPMVAGVATLLTDVGYDRFGGGNAVNGMVVKAVLLNSAHPTVGWNNDQQMVNGVLTTTQALDRYSGAGYMDAGQSFVQYTGGTANPSNGHVLLAPATVAQIGWDYGYLVPTSLLTNPYNDYLILPTLAGGSTFDATLSWYVDRTFNGLDDSSGTPTVSSSDLRFTNLDLELWTVSNGLPGTLIALSDAAYISTQHFYFTLPSDGQYMLRVFWAGDQYNVNHSDAEGQYYGLAWSGTTLTSAAAPDAPTWALVFGGGALGAMEWARRGLLRSRGLCRNHRG